LIVWYAVANSEDDITGRAKGVWSRHTGNYAAIS
jgi:hypothetical protein